MNRGRFSWALLLALSGSLAAHTAQAQNLARAPLTLLARDSLTGWRSVLADATSSPEDTWSVREGVLTCSGQPSGYLITNRDDFQDYRLQLEWRWHTGRGGNNGVLVHCSTPGALDIWCKSIEIQLAHENAGDFWIIGTKLRVTDEERRRQDRRYVNLVDGVEKPLGEWNQMEIHCQGNEITVSVNGVLVNRATDVSETRGAISLQSEGTPIQFRNLKLTPLR